MLNETDPTFIATFPALHKQYIVQRIPGVSQYSEDIYKLGPNFPKLQNSPQESFEYCYNLIDSFLCCSPEIIEALQNNSALARSYQDQFDLHDKALCELIQE